MKEAQLRSGKAKKVAAKHTKKIKSQKLTKRTKLTPDQLKRVKGSAGRGEAARYSPNGEQSLELTRRLYLARKKARKFALYTDQLGRRLYIADKDLVAKQLNTEEIERSAYLTFNREEALPFYEGFDEPADKLSYYNEFHKLNFLTLFL